MQALPDIAKVNGELQAQQKTYENDLKGMQDELTRQNEAYEKGKSTMNPTKQQPKEQEHLPTESCPSVPVCRTNLQTVSPKIRKKESCSSSRVIPQAVLPFKEETPKRRPSFR